jgi:hypothetical protein
MFEQQVNIYRDKEVRYALCVADAPLHQTGRLYFTGESPFAVFKSPFWAINSNNSKFCSLLLISL